MKNRMIKSGIVIMLAASMLLTGCGGSSTSEGSTDGAHETKAEAAQEENAATGVTIEEQVLIDENGVTVTATGLKAKPMMEYVSYYVEITVKNETDKMVGIYCDGSTVNGYNCYAGSKPLEGDCFGPGETEGQLYLTGTAFRIGQFDKIGEITLSDVRVSEQELKTMEDLDGQTVEYYEEKDGQYENPMCKVDRIEIKTSEYDNVEIGAIPEGEVLFEGDGVTVVAVKSDYEKAQGELIYLKNDTDDVVYTDVNNFSVNGIKNEEPLIPMTTPTLMVKPNSVEIGYFGNDEADQAYLKDIGVEEVEEISCTINVYYYFSPTNITDIEYNYTAE